MGVPVPVLTFDPSSSNVPGKVKHYDPSGWGPVIHMILALDFGFDRFGC